MKGYRSVIINRKASSHNSRLDANNIMRKVFPDIDWRIFCVHHIDENPFNNDFNNLQLIRKATHTKMHNYHNKNKVAR